ncbi:MAG TPA: hypothetical protein VGN07_16690 [Steroidobacteraceae bacterium]
MSGFLPEIVGAAGQSRDSNAGMTAIAAMTSRRVGCAAEACFGCTVGSVPIAQQQRFV